MKLQAKIIKISVSSSQRKVWQFHVNLLYHKSCGSKGAQKGIGFNMSPLPLEKWGKVQSNKVHVIHMGYK